METDHNHLQTSGMCIPVAWSPLDAYRYRGNRVPKMPEPCPCGHKECRKDYEEIKKQVEEIIEKLSTYNKKK